MRHKYPHPQGGVVVISPYGKSSHLTRFPHNSCRLRPEVHEVT